jgi:hypothetical protein
MDGFLLISWPLFPFSLAFFIAEVPAGQVLSAQCKERIMAVDSRYFVKYQGVIKGSSDCQTGIYPPDSPSRHHLPFDRIMALRKMEGGVPGVGEGVRFADRCTL